MALSFHEKLLLTKVLEVAGDDEKMVREGIIKALRGENDRGRRGYLWRTLERESRKKIRRARKKAEQNAARKQTAQRQLATA